MAPPTQHRVMAARERGRRPATQGPAFLSNECGGLTNQEQRFLVAAEGGDVVGVRRALGAEPGLHLNCTDYRDQNALQLAVGGGHLEVTTLLLRQGGLRRLGDALLLAISRGHAPCSHALLADPAFASRLNCCPGDLPDDDHFFWGDGAGPRFSSDITPLLLAARRGRYATLALLLGRGAAIRPPHRARCPCHACLRDPFSHAHSRLNAYRALASPAYLALASPDPALSALELCHQLDSLEHEEQEYKNDYRKLSLQCKDFMVDVLDLCRDTEEVAAILNGDMSAELEAGPAAGMEAGLQSRLLLSRVRLAIKYEVKKLVAHPSCQQQLLGLWYEGVEGLRNRSLVTKCLLVLLVALWLPLLAMAYWLAPCSRLGKVLRSPFMKLVTHAASFLLFLLLLLINASDHLAGSAPNTTLLPGSAPNTMLADRHIYRVTTSRLSWTETLIMVWVTGMVWSECKQLWCEGVCEYALQRWNPLDWVMLSLYVASFSARLQSLRLASRAQQRLHQLLSDHLTLDALPPDVTYYTYERDRWSPSDPQLVSEGLYSVAVVLSFCRVSSVLLASETLGPLQISLGRTLTHVAKFLLLFLLLFLPFMMGLFTLYSPYRGAKVNPAFTTVEESFRTLFWSIFGLSDVSSVVLNCDHKFIENIGYVLYGLYTVTMVVVLLNVLIAMINSSYQEIESDADVEWKFARSKLWLSYFSQSQTLPPPFSLMPCPLPCPLPRPLWRWMDASNAALSSPTAESYSLNSIPNQPTRHQQVMKRLMKRFVLKAQVEQEHHQVNHGELQEIKQDISSLRSDLLEDNNHPTEHLSQLLHKLTLLNTSPSSSTNSPY